MLLVVVVEAGGANSWQRRRSESICHSAAFEGWDSHFLFAEFHLFPFMAHFCDALRPPDLSDM